ncbi:MAG: hypothetical protein AAF927_05360 [Bacteroidota bacterium]
MLTIPLTEKRFKQDLSFRQGLFRRKPKEFVQLEKLRLGGDWPEYKQYMVQPLLEDIHFLRHETKCTIDYDVSFADFKRAYLSGQYDTIFLLAHHIEYPEPGFVEFVDGGIAMQKLVQLLMTSPKAQAPLFFVCKSQKSLEQVKKSRPELISAIATAEMDIFTLSGFYFIRLWISEMQGQSLEEAYALAIDKFLNQNE